MYRPYSYVLIFLSCSYSCEPFNPTPDFLPRSCVELYNIDGGRPGNGNIDASGVFPGIRRALINELLNDIADLSENHDCVQLVQRYFCDYYYPICDVENGIITPVCSSSCNLLFNNEDCSNLLTEAISMMEDQGFPEVPSDDSCEETLLTLTGPPEPTVSVDTCASIESRNIIIIV